MGYNRLQAINQTATSDKKEKRTISITCRILFMIDYLASKKAINDTTAATTKCPVKRKTKRKTIIAITVAMLVAPHPLIDGN